MKHVLAPVLALSALCPGATLGWTSAVSEGDVGIRDVDPQMPHDANTIADCSWWYDNDGSLSCSDMLSLYGVDPAAFSYWNPSVSVNCDNFKTGQSYCVEGPDPPAETPTTTTTTTAKPTTTAPGNGITTPSPIQEGMVDDCNKFFFVEKGTSCSTVLSTNGLTIAQLYAMNPGVGSDCAGMWAQVYVCVGTIGGSPTTTAKPTTTAPGNGITTPSPIQEGMVDDCNKFFFVEKGMSCSNVLSTNSLTIAQLYAMNPGVGSDCAGMWAQVYVCVSTIGGIGGSPTTTTKPTTTAPGNGITTPSPIQEGMVDNCNAFYFVKQGTSCSTVLSTNHITLDLLYKWNPGVGQDCSGLWAEVNVCVGTTDYTPPTTTKGNGVVTPTPTQTGMVGNCKTFYFVKSGDSCDSIAKKYGISVANFKNWNKGVGSDCTGMWKDAYVCVGLI